jgi:DNA-binding NtrC family response regulator
MAFQVLIMEKNTLIRDALTQMVFLCGCHAVSTQTTDFVLGSLTGVRFDLLIAGIAPGDESIPDLIHAARERQPSIGIIVGISYTAETQASQLVDAYVPFPLSIHELRAAMQKILNKMPVT